MPQKIRMANYYILDTSVLLFDPKSILSFKENHVVVPETVLKELDKKKNLNTVLGKHARESIRILKYHSEKGKKGGSNIIEGVQCDNHKGTIRIFSEDLDDVPKSLNKEDADNKILSVAVTFSKKYNDSKIYLVTKDTSLELKALVHNVDTNDYSQLSKSKYSGYTGVHIDPKPRSSLVAKIYQSDFGSIPIPKKYKDKTYENGFIIMKGSDDKKGKQDLLMQRKGNKLEICEGRYSLRALRVKPLNHEQYFAMNLLMDPDIHLVTLNGPAGCGKTILGLAAGFCLIDDEKGLPYNKIMFARSLTPLGGRDQIGYLRGSLEEKLAPWILPISDNINFIMHAPTDPTSNNPYNLYQHLVDDGDLEITALQYIRGRSLTNTFLIIDEVQNITKNEIYTIISRIGEGSKIVLLGDNLQVDAPYLSRNDNALVHVIEAFKDSFIAGHVTLTQSVRSELAKEAAERLIF